MLLLLFFLIGFEANAAEFEIRVTGTQSGSAPVVVSAIAPEDFPRTGILKDAAGAVPFETVRDELVFVLPTLRPGETRVFKANPANPPNRAVAQEENGRVDLSVGGKRVLTYQGKETEPPRPDIKRIYKRGGYIHPVLSPSGKLLTDDYARNHLHQHGIWAPWTKTIFEGRHPDFWNMGDGTGKVEFEALGSVWSGPVAAGFTARHRFVDLSAPEPKIALNETWQVTAYSIPSVNYFMFDLISTQRCATASPLFLPKYLYGGLGFRGNWDWNGDDKCQFLTSDGETNRVKGNETRMRWCHIGGKVDGGLTGIAILSHPENFRSPQPVRIHPKEPYLCFAPSEAGDWEIDPGQAYVARYRFIVKDGQPDKVEIDALWDSYAHPPKVEVTRKMK